MADYSGGPTPISLSQAATATSSSSSDNPTLSITPSAMATASASTSSKRRTTKNRDKTTETTPTTVGRKPRGRPPGSKNKPKPPVIITRETPPTTTHPPALSPVILEISPGSDIIDSIITFARKQNKGISVISASGSVSAVTLRHVSLHGPFTLVSLSGTFFANGEGTQSPSSSPSCCFGITLAAAQGQVFGGVVGGKVTAAGPVVVVGSVFENALFQTLPNGEEENAETGEEVKGGGGEEESGGVCSSAGVGVGYGGSPAPMNSQMPPSDHVMHWGAPRPPPY